MIYIIFNDSHEVDDCWHGGSSIDYVSLSLDNAVSFFNKLKESYIKLDGSEIDEVSDNKFIIYNGKWCYDYEILKLPEDIDLRYINYGKE